MTTIGMTSVHYGHMSHHAQALIRQLRDEIFHYGGNLQEEINDDSLLALAVNPFGIIYLLPEMRVLSKEVEENTENPHFIAGGKNIKDRVRSVLKKELEELCSEKIKEIRAYQTNTQEVVGTDDDEDPRVKRRRLMRMESARQAGNVDAVEGILDTWFQQQSFNIVSTLSSQQRQQIPKEKIKKLQEAAANETIVDSVEDIVQDFDVMEWWELHGKAAHPLIYIVACCILPMPDSNADQERSFSTATWMDELLKSLQGDLTYQIKVLNNLNSEFLKDHRAFLRDEHRKEGLERIAALVKSHIQKNLEVTPEMEEWLTMYEEEGREKDKDKEERKKEGKGGRKEGKKGRKRPGQPKEG